MFRLADSLNAELGDYWRQALLRRGVQPPQITGLPPVLEDERNFRRAGPLGVLIGKVQRRLRGPRPNSARGHP
jgi:hypothetical protein